MILRGAYIENQYEILDMLRLQILSSLLVVEKGATICYFFQLSLAQLRLLYV